MSWELVTKVLARNDASEPRVRINRANEVVITAAAHRLMGEPTHVRLLVDRERRLLALEPSGADDPEAFRLSGKAGIRRFSTVALTRAFGLERRRQAFTPVYDDAAGHLVVGPYAVAVTPDPDAPTAEEVRRVIAQANGSGQAARR